MRRVGSWSRRSVVDTSVTEIVGDDTSGGSETVVSEIELRTWSQPLNPAFTKDEMDNTSSTGKAFMAAPPPAPKRSVNRTERRKRLASKGKSTSMLGLTPPPALERPITD